MFRWIAHKWAVNDPLPKKVDLLAIISYASKADKLTNCSWEVLHLAREIYWKHIEASIGWGSFYKNPSKYEQETKKKHLQGHQNFYVGEVSSTTDECEAIKVYVTDKKPKSTVVVAEGSHSRRAKRVWQYYFPHSEICFRSVPAEKAEDPRNPMFLMRNWRFWLTVNILLYPLLHGQRGQKNGKVELQPTGVDNRLTLFRWGEPVFNNKFAYFYNSDTIKLIMSITGTIPYVQIVLSVLLIGGVLLQQSEAGLGSGFGGGDGFSSGHHTKRGVEKIVFISTITISIVFALTSFSLLLL